MKKYNSYKSSGVEWIGNIPENWSCTKFKYVSKLYTGNSLNDEQKLMYESDNEDEIPYVSSKDIDLNSQKVNYDNGLRIPRENNPLKVSPNGSFLLCVEGGSSGRKMVYLDREVCFVNKLCSFKSELNTKFQYYFIQSSNYQDKFKLSLSGLIGGVSISVLRDIELILPPLPEQHQIVQFLDEKTEIIDKLISTKERKIDLLKDQRTSLINQVITKGLDPKVKMKESGVEWVGEIPEHWETGKLKHNCDLRISSVDKHILENERSVNVCNYTDVYYNDFITNSLDLRIGSCSEEEFNKFKLSKGDVIITKDSESPNDIGVPSIVIDELDNVVCGYHLSILKPNKNKIIGGYLFRQLQTKRIRNYYEVCSNGITRFGLGKSSVLDTSLIIPPIEEQHQIVEHLDTHTKEIDDLVNMEQKKIDLLKEYRQSLISEVITGKIDVRTNLN
jgi:type I restriction enzyme S subunit